MAFRGLLFTTNPETSHLLTDLLRESGIRVEVSADIFTAITKGTKQTFSCIIADWADQPEAGFLLKRARESGVNRNTVAIAVVDSEPTPDEQRDHRVDFLFYRPISMDEVQSVLAKARQQMELQSAAIISELGASFQETDVAKSSVEEENPSLVPVGAEVSAQPVPTPEEVDERGQEEALGEIVHEEVRRRKHRVLPQLRTVFAVAVVMVAAFCLSRSRDAFRYLAYTSEGRLHVLRESVAALFYRSGAPPVSSVDLQQDAYFNRTPGTVVKTPTPIGVIDAEVSLSDIPLRPPRAFDFPLPTPVLLHRDEVLHPSGHAPVPESLRTSAPITRPVVVAVNPALMPVSTPAPHSSIEPVGEPAHLSEEAARALLVESADPVYPPEALAQKLHGLVVLQAVIGRDGTIQDLKIVRGYFVLGRAAIAAVKQWRFRPYSVNGKPVEAQTQITITFSAPPA